MKNIIKVESLIVKFLAWYEKHQAPRTVEWYEGYLNSFLKHPGIAELPILNIKPYHVMEWIDSKHTWGDTYKRGAIVAIQRLCNWSEELGYIETPLLKKMKKPMAKRREIYMTKPDFDEILAKLPFTDPFRDLFVFVWLSGCRPQEIRHIEPRHVDIDFERIVFPAEESKGKRTKRIIYLQGESLEIIKRRLADTKDGQKLFRNTRGEAWTKYSLCNRMNRLSKIIGKRMFLYAARHGFGTRKLIQGHDHLTVAALMGHTDGSMLAKIYSHIEKDTVHLKKALMD